MEGYNGVGGEDIAPYVNRGVAYCDVPCINSTNYECYRVNKMLTTAYVIPFIVSS